jgi:hypothetical protein
MEENIYSSGTAINRKEHWRERKMCRLVIIECGLGLRRVGDV